jgi:energy-coupling factor transport system ATP-binding protein
MQAEVIVLDEPTAQLDPIAAKEFLGMLCRVNTELGKTVVLSEHRLEDVLS